MENPPFSIVDFSLFKPKTTEQFKLGESKTLRESKLGVFLNDFLMVFFFYDSPKVPVTWRMGSQLDPVVRI